MGKWYKREKSCKIGDIGKIYLGEVRGQTEYGVTMLGEGDIWYFEEDELEFVKYMREWKRACLHGIKS